MELCFTYEGSTCTCYMYVYNHILLIQILQTYDISMVVIVSHQVWDDGLTDHIDEGEIRYLYGYELLIHRSISEKCK